MVWSGQCTMHTAHYSPQLGGGGVACQILGLKPRIGRIMQVKNTMTTSLCWTHNASSLIWAIKGNKKVYRTKTSNGPVSNAVHCHNGKFPFILRKFRDKDAYEYPKLF
jgi:hypothetical protein